MKLKEIEKQNGIYVGCRLSKESNNKINAFIRNNNIPDYSENKIEKRKHVTIIYSKLFDNIKKEEYNYLAYGNKFDIFGTKQDKKCLVLKLNCPDIIKRHRILMSFYNLTYDFPTYQPHITLSYDIGDYDWQKLPMFNEELFLQDEYIEELKNE